ncbi:probable G-protein coupled receptor 139 [Stegostoma tigrinum]|uniref:probable G-protein coupled receptor 139 n=1 Tax=Stegostoma tigrinum TaxID=3053191 RepID=UPI0028703448|nr:probable G-protein coupled receptor 139 [Stegostoma tigrinum]XP_059500243.1 probable G-protein coupled receptor 139 [Stegostoma tigrinum]
MHGIPKGLAFAIYYPIIAAIGIPANLAVIVILVKRRCGLSKCVTFYLVSMAVADLLLIISGAVLNRISGIFFPLSFLSITPICSLRIAFIYAAIDCSAWLTVAFTFDRFVAICCQKLKTKYCNGKAAQRIIGIIYTLSCLRNTFLYFIYEPLYIINSVPWFCGIKVAFYTSVAWDIFDWLLVIFTPCLPFILILLLNALTVRHILSANRARRRLQVQRNGEDQNDPEVQRRAKSIVLLFAISGSFMLLYLLYFITIVYVRVVDVTYFSGSDFSDTTFLLEENGYMLQFLSSCINPFIYVGTQRKFRDELKKGWFKVLAILPTKVRKLTLCSINLLFADCPGLSKYFCSLALPQLHLSAKLSLHHLQTWQKCPHMLRSDSVVLTATNTPDVRSIFLGINPRKALDFDCVPSRALRFHTGKLVRAINIPRQPQPPLPPLRIFLPLWNELILRYIQKDLPLMFIIILGDLPVAGNCIGCDVQSRVNYNSQAPQITDQSRSKYNKTWTAARIGLTSDK